MFFQLKDCSKEVSKLVIILVFNIILYVIGGSSGTIMCAAIKAAKTLNIAKGKRIVAILPDGIRNYMTKFVTDQWMEAHLFMDPPEQTMR